MQSINNKMTFNVNFTFCFDEAMNNGIVKYAKTFIKNLAFAISFDVLREYNLTMVLLNTDKI